MVAERFTSRWDTLAFVACVLVALVARAMPESTQEFVAALVRRTLLAPLLTLEHQTELLRSSQTRLRALVAERDSAAVAAMQAETLGEENARLRQLLGLRDRLRGAAVSAEILRQATPAGGFTVTLSAGTARGVRALSPVVTPDGLLGVVRSVDRERAVTVLWTHPDFRVSAMTPDGSVFGLIAPRGQAPADAMGMLLSGVPYRDVIPAGTALLTSGFGGVYPRGIPIGEVVGVADEQEGVSRTYLVRAAVHPASAAHVIVLVNPDADIAGAFSRGRQ